jgi:hypothetical protein
LLAQKPVLAVEIHVTGHAFETRAKIIDVKRLGDVILGAHARGGDGGIDGPVLRQHQDGDLRVHFMNLLQKIEPARGRQDQVSDNDIDRVIYS